MERAFPAAVPATTMDQWCDDNYRTALAQIKAWRIPKVGSDVRKLEYWLNNAAGNGVNEHLGWGWAGWKFWLGNRRLHKLIMDGVMTPATYRLFEGREGGRKRWDGAEEAIYKANGKTPPARAVVAHKTAD